MPSINRLIFMGSPDYALPTLETLYAQFGAKIVGVFTRPDQPKGRGQHPSPTPIKTWALDHGIPVFTPSTKTETAELVASLAPDFIVVIAYGMILPDSIVDPIFCLNAHGSLLPNYRGASPIHASLLHGDTTTGVSLIRMNAKMDEGDVVFSAELPILETDNLGSLHDKLSALSAQCCDAFIREQYLQDQVQAVPQIQAQATYCQKLTKADSELLPSETGTQWLRKIRAFSPTPGAWLVTESGKIKILAAHIETKRLVPDTVQPEGKRPMPYADYLLGHPTGLTIPPC